MKKLLIALLICLPTLGQAQSPVITQAYGVTTKNSSSTIGSTGVFQSLWAATVLPQRRAACTVQNNGTHTMYVFFGPIASATTATSITLAAGQSVTCNTTGSTLQDQVSITGTTSDAFYAAQQ